MVALKETESERNSPSVGAHTGHHPTSIIIPTDQEGPVNARKFKGTDAIYLRLYLN